MKELSLHILDVAQNSVTAGASFVRISVEEDTAADRMTITIADDGRGMPPDVLARVRDPFYTTRATRSIGLGIPLFRMAAQQSGGGLEIQSAPGQGTTVTAIFGLTHIDRMPLGDMGSTMATLIGGHPAIDCVYSYRRNADEFALDTRELRAVLEDVPLDTPDVAAWIRAFVLENENEITGGVYSENIG